MGVICEGRGRQVENEAGNLGEDFERGRKKIVRGHKDFAYHMGDGDREKGQQARWKQKEMRE